MQSDSELALRLKDVSVSYRSSFERRATLAGRIKRAGRAGREVRTITAVSHVTFDLPRGNVLGIIGNNGAGKTSLIRAISGIIPPSTGRIEVHGRVNTLLMLGVGFNLRLTGYENVILGGLAMGYSREDIEARSEEIGAWTELGEFLDMPVSTYSAGMRARLGFSVAFHLDPDILIVDEALSAGDARFKAKAMKRMEQMLERAQTMVLVSHSMATVQKTCTDAIWLEQGQLRMHDTPANVIEAYAKANRVNKNSVSTQEDF